MEKKNCCSEIFESTTAIIGILSTSEKGYFQLGDTSLVVPVCIIKSDMDINTNELEVLIKSLSQNKQYLIKIKRYYICMIRQRKQSMTLLSPSHRKTYNLGNTTCVLLFNFKDCEMIKSVNAYSKDKKNTIIGKKRSLLAMLDLDEEQDIQLCMESVSMIFNDNKNGTHYVIQARHNGSVDHLVKLYLFGSCLRLYPIFHSYACIQCDFIIDDNKLMINSNKSIYSKLMIGEI